MRYQFMKKSTRDGVGGDFYYDILSTRYSDDIPDSTNQVTITSLLIDRFDLFAAKAYGSMAYADLVLDFNGIAHRSEMVVGEPLIVPTKAALDSFIQKWKQDDV
jgi:hypothetical protein